MVLHVGILLGGGGLMPVYKWVMCGVRGVFVVVVEAGFEMGWGVMRSDVMGWDVMFGFRSRYVRRCEGM